jgi:hypothetical protein
VSHVSGQARRHSCLRAAGLLAGALAIVAGASACSGGSSPAASGLSRQAGTGAGRGTPSGSLAYWLGQVVAGNDTAACEDMAEPLKGSAAPRPNTANACASKSNPSSAGVSALHTNFAADGIRPGNSFRIGAVHIAGKIAGVKATDIHVAGSTLTSVMLKHSTGVKPGQLKLSFLLMRFHRAWYVTGVNLKF